MLTGHHEVLGGTTKIGMSDPNLPPPPDPPGPPHGPPTGPPSGAYPAPPPLPGSSARPGPPPPGAHDRFGQGPDPQYGQQQYGQQQAPQYGQWAQPAAQPFVGGHIGPDWIHELGVRVGSTGTRIGAKALDIVFIVVVQIALGVVAGLVFVTSSVDATNTSFLDAAGTTDIGYTLALSAVLLVIDFLYNVVVTAKFGGTPGKLILSLRVIHTDGRPIDFRGAFLRWSPILALTLLAMVPIVGLLAVLLRVVLLIGNLIMVLTDERRRSLFDRVAGTYVIAGR